MASNWIADLTGQRIYDSGIEVQPTVKEWNLKGADIAYNPLTKRVDIEVGGGVNSDWKKSETEDPEPPEAEEMELEFEKEQEEISNEEKYDVPF